MYIKNNNNREQERWPHKYIHAVIITIIQKRHSQEQYIDVDRH